MKRKQFTEERIIGVLKEYEAENQRLKRLYADAMLDNAALKDVLSKKW